MLKAKGWKNIEQRNSNQKQNMRTVLYKTK